ncbi:MAG: hypothetical protein AAFW89_11900 [Bacteroidota bacterium]
MKEILQQLANLQYIDSRIDELKQLRGDLPEEILDIETDIARLQAKVNNLSKEKTDLMVEYDQVKLDLATSEEKIRKYEDQQMTVRNNREYDALTKEIEAQKLAIEHATNRLIEIEKRQESIGPELEVAEQNLHETTSVLEEKRTNLDSVMESTQEEEDKLLDIREELVQEIDARYMRNYNRLRNGLSNGIAVVAMERGAAFGMALPPQTQVEVRRMNKIIIDENSGRIVVDQTFFKTAKAKFTI